jgi:hypothetical protein
VRFTDFFFLREGLNFVLVLDAVKMHVDDKSLGSHLLRQYKFYFGI